VCVRMSRPHTPVPPFIEIFSTSQKYGKSTHFGVLSGRTPAQYPKMDFSKSREVLILHLKIQLSEEQKMVLK
jgi:hypothetical protein